MLLASPKERTSQNWPIGDERIFRTRMTNQDFAHRGIIVGDQNDRANRFLGGARGRTVYQIYPETTGRVANDPDWLPDVERRVTNLRTEAREENLPFAEASAIAALTFARSLHGYHRPSVFLVGNGNLRLVWSSDTEDRLGLQFREDDKVQFVASVRFDDMFEETYGTKHVSRLRSFLDRQGWTGLMKAAT
jgi:hypothetical protein